MRPRVYISGPLSSSGNPVENVATAVGVMRRLITMGFAPFCPHLSWYADPGEEVEHQVWLDVDLAWVAVADAVLRLPGESKGADREVEFALGRVPVFDSVEKLVACFATKLSRYWREPWNTAETSVGHHSRGA